MEYLDRIHHIAALQQSPRVTVKIERTTRKFHWTIVFISMFNDISWNLKTMKKNANQVLSSFLSKQKKSAGQMVIPRMWMRKEMVFNS